MHCRLCKEIIQNVCSDIHFAVPRVQYIALEALQMAAEAYLVGVLEESNLAAIHAKCATLMKKDMDLCLRIRGGVEKMWASKK